MQEIPHILGFTSGELTPWLESRYDLQAYRRGAALIRNFIVQPYGGLQRRRGSAFVGMAGSQEADAVRLFAFSFSDTDSLMLEFCPGAMRVYRDGVLQTVAREGANGVTERVPYVLEHPWTTAEQVRTLRFTQVNDAVYVTCPSYPPVVLYRTDDTDWRWEAPSFDPYPRATYSPQKDAIVVELSWDRKTAKLILPEDSEQVFTHEMAGKEYVMVDADVRERTLFAGQAFSAAVTPVSTLRNITLQPFSYIATADETSGMWNFWTVIKEFTPESYYLSDDPSAYPQYFLPGVPRYDLSHYAYEVGGEWELRTAGAWNAQWELWRSYDTDKPVSSGAADANGNRHPLYWDWTCIKSFGQDKFTERRNWALTGSEPRPCRMLIVCRSADGTSIASPMLFRIFRSRREYKFLITEVEDAHTAWATLESHHYLNAQYKISSNRWSFGAFGSYNGYPAFSAYHADRLWFGGMRRTPTTLLGSAVDDFHNFRVVSDDDSAMHLTIASDNQSRICWVAPTRQLLVGTSDGVWLLSGGDGGPLTPSNANFRLQTSVGCENMPPLSVENCVLFAQRSGKRLREISYKLEADGFSATDLSLLSEHLFSSGIREYAVQEGTGSYIWTVMNDGTAAVLTLHGEQQVSAWQRVSFPGRRVLHVAALPRSGSELDEVWLVLRNESNDAVSLERVNGETPFLDGSLTLSSDAEGTLYGLAHWAGQEVLAVDAAGVSQRGMVAADGSLSGLSPDTEYTVGVPYLSELQTMPMESEMSYNSVREFSRVRLRLYESSLDFEYKAAHAGRWESGLAAARMEKAPYSGSLRLDQMPDAGVGQGFSLRCGGTEDFRLLAMSIEVDHHGK